jgi:hypothetical protein
VYMDCVSIRYAGKSNDNEDQHYRYEAPRRMTEVMTLVICMRGVSGSNIGGNQLSRLMLFVVFPSLSGLSRCNLSY